MEKALKGLLTKGRFSEVRPQTRRIMSRIGPGAASTEQSFRMKLVRARLTGWHTNSIVELTRPDIYFARKRIAIFLDGCFWHACPKCGHFPKTRRAFWKEKFRRNRLRDRRDVRRLTKNGVKVVRIWEHNVRRRCAKVEALIAQLR
jgi:DNA mismatch endonuclease (patch repair protein)